MLLQETWLFLWAEVAPPPLLQVFPAMKFNKCHAGEQGVCSQSTQWWHCTVGLYPHLLSLVSLLRRAVCSFQLIVHCQRLCLFSCCIFFPPAGKGRQLSITVRCLLVDMCNFLLLCQMQNDHVVWEYVGVLAQGWIFKALTSQERFSPRLCCWHFLAVLSAAFKESVSV